MIFTIAVDSDIFKMAPYYDDVYNRRQTAMLALKRKSDGDAWDTNKVNWETLKQNEPFFMVINSTKSHDSGYACGTNASCNALRIGRCLNGEPVRGSV